MSNLRIIFMGTPFFALCSLKMMVASSLNVVAVITAPDRRQGRGQKQAYSPVKRYALQHNLPLLQPVNLKSPEFLKALRRFTADIQVVVAFRMLPEEVWSMPVLGTFNLHASLLPHYRGAAPIHWAIINGEKETGVSTFFINYKIDTGNIIFQEKEPILDADDAGALHDRLMEKGAKLVLKTLKAITTDKYPSAPQHEHMPTKMAPKLFRNTCKINWSHSAREVYNFVRGLSPSPGAWTLIGDQVFKIFRVSIVTLSSIKDSPKKFITDNKSYLRFGVADGWVAVEELQPEGKKIMPIASFFRGNKIRV